MNGFVLAAMVLFVASLLMANPEGFLRLADDLATGIRRFHLHISTGHLHLRAPHAVLPPVSSTSLRIVGVVLGLVGLLICALS